MTKRTIRMKACELCKKQFPRSERINGKLLNYQNRKFCFDCSPKGSHNTKKILVKPVGEVGPNKTCSKCDVQKAVDQFYKNGKSIHSYCKLCVNKETMKSQRATKVRAIKYKGGKCKKCEYNKCNAALEFHHRNPSLKEFQFSKWRNASWEKLQPELDKCDLLCSNCHKEVHHEMYYNVTL